MHGAGLAFGGLVDAECSTGSKRAAGRTGPSDCDVRFAQDVKGDGVTLFDPTGRRMRRRMFRVIGERDGEWMAVLARGV